MNEPTIRVSVHGRIAEMTVSEAREMLRQLKRVFGETEVVVAPFVQPKVTPNPPSWPPNVWCGPVASAKTCGAIRGRGTYDLLMQN